MAQRKKQSKQEPNTTKGTEVPSGENRDKPGPFKNYWVTIGVPVTIALLVAWLTPLPGYIVHTFGHHSGNSSARSLPLTVAVQKAIGPCGNQWVVGKPLSSIPPAPSSLNPQQWASWARASSAVDADSTHVTATIQADPGHAVYITDIRFSVLKRQRPIGGKIFGPPCGGPIIGRYVQADLDQNPPRIIQTSSNPNAIIGMSGVGVDVVPLKLPYEITNTDGLVLILYGQVEKTDCIWTVDLTWSSDGKTGSITINNDGKPFETTPSKFAH